jgi:hypothetical protein
MHATWTTLRYRDGYLLHAPHHGGRIEMTLWSDGRARVASLPRPRGTPQVFEGLAAGWAVDAIANGLREVGFPDLPPRPLPEGVRVALLSVAAPGGTAQAWIAPAHRHELPPLDLAMKLIESIAHAVSHGVLGVPNDFERPLLP